MSAKPIVQMQPAQMICRHNNSYVCARTHSAQPQLVKVLIDFSFSRAPFLLCAKYEFTYSDTMWLQTISSQNVKRPRSAFLLNCKCEKFLFLSMCRFVWKEMNFSNTHATCHTHGSGRISETNESPFRFVQCGMRLLWII